MPAVKLVKETLDIEGHEPVEVKRLEMSNTFMAAHTRNLVPLKRGDGKVVMVNRKLATAGYYEGNGFTEPPRPAKEARA